MIKKLLGMSLLISAFLLTGCATSSTSVDTTTDTATDTTTESTGDTINIVATSFHEYDWLTQIIGEEDRFQITLLIDDGVDLHSYEPTVEDIATIISADLFIYNGGESDAWVTDILSSNPDLNSLSVMDILSDNVMASVVVDGMESDHDHDDEDADDDHDHDDEDTDDDHDHDDEDTDDDHDHDDEDTDDDHDHDDDDAHDDEHVWLSLNNAKIVCEYFAVVLAELDSDNEETYVSNVAEYVSELEALNEAYEEMVTFASRDTIIVTDRFPFLYLVNDYGINYYAAFEGCSAETEASFETIVFLTEKADEYNVNYLLIVENGLVDLASTVASSCSIASCETLELNSMQSITQADIDAGTTYLSIMEENLEVLKLALSE